MPKGLGEMPDSNEVLQTGEKPQADQTPVQTQDTSGSDTQGAAKFEAELAELREALKRVNNESASRRKKLEEYEKAEQERKDAELSEMEKLNKRLADAEAARTQAEQRAQTTLIRAAFIAEASKSDAQFPEDAYRLASHDDVTIDDDGNVQGVAEAVKKIVDSGRLPLKDKRVKAPSLDAGAGGGQSPAEAKANALTETELQIARKMGITPEQYAAHKNK